MILGGGVMQAHTPADPVLAHESTVLTVMVMHSTHHCAAQSSMTSAAGPHNGHQVCRQGHQHSRCAGSSCQVTRQGACTHVHMKCKSSHTAHAHVFSHYCQSVKEGLLVD
mmetsp:Transcript_18109/g.38971  ORF Transcript_18109/g.38971 Transcript_18109/m.38971 type:complete len:110 (+) Transcript_18109:595-924(+)